MNNEERDQLASLLSESPGKKTTLGTKLNAGISVLTLLTVVFAGGSFKATTESYQRQSSESVDKLTRQIESVSNKQAEMDRNGTYYSQAFLRQEQAQIASLDNRLSKVEDVVMDLRAIRADLGRVVLDIIEIKKDLKAPHQQ